MKAPYLLELKAIALLLNNGCALLQANETIDVVFQSLNYICSSSI